MTSMIREATQEFSRELRVLIEYSTRVTGVYFTPSGSITIHLYREGCAGSTEEYLILACDGVNYILVKDLQRA